MKQYQVPQFIDIEDKIVGPLTIKQFLYLVGAGAFGIVFYYLFPFYLFIILTLPFALLALALAFVKINGIPFPRILTHILSYFSKPHLYIWKQLPAIQKKLEIQEQKTTLKIPKLTESKLQDIAWSLDIKEHLE